jgi:hypothetical protein
LHQRWLHIMFAMAKTPLPLPAHILGESDTSEQKRKNNANFSHRSNIRILCLFDGLKHLIHRISHCLVFVFDGKWCVEHKVLQNSLTVIALNGDE